MREYWLLTKLQLSAFYGINKIRHARDDDGRKKAKRSLTALAAMVFGLAWASTIYSMALATAFQQMGQLTLMLGLMAAASGALVLVFSVFETKGVLFGFGDYDTVMSWPVRTSAVVAARVTTMYAYNFVYALLLMLPAGVVYAVNAHPPVWFYPAYLVGILATPTLPTALGAALGTIMTVLTARMKHKSLASSAGQIVLAIGIMALSFSLNSGLSNIAQQAASLGQSLHRVWPPAGWLMRAVQGDVVALLLSIVAAALVMLAFSWLLSLRFVELNGRLSAMPHAKAKHFDMRRTSGTVRALYRVEWKRYMGSSLYLANTAFGYVLVLALAVVLGILKLPAVNEIFSDPALPAMRTAIPLMVSLMVTMSATTGSAISIEGKRLWIVKSLPVRMRDWLTAKLLVSLTLAVPTVLIFTGIVGIGMHFSPAEWLFSILTPLSYALLAGVGGLFVNLKLPKFDWSTEAEIVKQSASMMICVFAGMLAVGVPFGLLLVTNSQDALPVATVVALALAGLLFYLVNRGGDEKLYRL